MSTWTIIGFVVLALAVAALARRDKIEAILRRFDEANLNKTRRLLAARRTPNAHMLLTVEEIAARTEPVETVWAPDLETGRLSKRFLWRGETFLRAEDAEAARRQAILREAREFYVELDQRQLG